MNLCALIRIGTMYYCKSANLIDSFIANYLSGPFQAQALCELMTWDGLIENTQLLDDPNIL